MKKAQLPGQASPQNRKETLRKNFDACIVILLNYGRRFSPDAQLIETCVADIFEDLWKNHMEFDKSPKTMKIFLMQKLRKQIELKQSESRQKRA